jgi:hypothetical protein
VRRSRRLRGGSHGKRQGSSRTIPNLPLALPALFNVAYLRSSRLLVARALVTVMVLLNAALFVGSLFFVASGKTYEEISGIR